ncbi:hypothetical protein BDY19DRAFT_877339, partial [Irpex rosettiformis]
PTFGFCCNDGLIHLPSFEQPPFTLMRLFDDETPQAREFRLNIRQYNAALAFTSLGVHMDEHINSGSGPYVFRIHGELCHRIGSLLPVPGHEPQYAQLYIHDPQMALNLRMRRNTNVRADTMELLQRVLADNHDYAAIYQHAHEIWQAHRGTAEDIPIRLIYDNAYDDRRRYNLPSADEIAVIIPGDGEQTTASRDIILHVRSGQLQRIQDCHPAYAPLHYVLLFP